MSMTESERGHARLVELLAHFQGLVKPDRLISTAEKTSKGKRKGAGKNNADG